MVSDEEENIQNPGSSGLQDEPSTIPVSISLFLPQHIFLSTFLGGALAGFVLLAYNYQKLGFARHFKACLIIALVVVSSLLNLILLLPDNRWDRAWPVGIAIAMTIVATYLQDVRKLALSKNIIVEAKSIWLAIANALLCLFVQFVIVVAILKFLE